MCHRVPSYFNWTLHVGGWNRTFLFETEIERFGDHLCSLHQNYELTRLFAVRAEKDLRPPSWRSTFRLPRRYAALVGLRLLMFLDSLSVP